MRFFIFLLVGLMISCTYLFGKSTSTKKPTPSLGTPQIKDISLRERCRREISGAFISVFDEHRRAELNVIRLNEELTILERSLINSQKQVDRKQREADAKEFEIAKQRELEGAKTNLEMSRAKIEETRQLLSEDKKIFAVYKKREEAWRKDLTKIFRIEMLKNDANFSQYPYMLTYLQVCGEYRIECPLEKHYAYDLCRFVSETPDIEAPHCVQYVGLSGIECKASPTPSATPNTESSK